MWYFREDNNKNRVDKNKQLSVNDRGCTYFINEMHVTKRDLRQLKKKLVCKRVCSIFTFDYFN